VTYPGTTSEITDILLSIKKITFGEREFVEDREQFVCKIEPYVSFSNPDILSIYCMQI